MHLLDLIELRIVKEGMGTWCEVQTMPVEKVLDAFHYSVFLASYSETHHVLNSPDR